MIDSMHAIATPSSSTTNNHKDLKVYVASVSGTSEIRKQIQWTLMVLDGLNVPFSPIDITIGENENEREFMREKAINKRCPDVVPMPPQFFFRDEYLGDYTDFEEAVENNTLEDFLKLIPPDDVNEVEKSNGTEDKLEDEDIEGEDESYDEDESDEATDEEEGDEESDEDEGEDEEVENEEKDEDEQLSGEDESIGAATSSIAKAASSKLHPPEPRPTPEPGKKGDSAKNAQTSKTNPSQTTTVKEKDKKRAVTGAGDSKLSATAKPTTKPLQANGPTLADKKAPAKASRPSALPENKPSATAPTTATKAAYDRENKVKPAEKAISSHHQEKPGVKDGASKTNGPTANFTVKVPPVEPSKTSSESGNKIETADKLNVGEGKQEDEEESTLYTDEDEEDEEEIDEEDWTYEEVDEEEEGEDLVDELPEETKKR